MLPSNQWLFKHTHTHTHFIFANTQYEISDSMESISNVCLNKIDSKWYSTQPIVKGPAQSNEQPQNYNNRSGWAAEFVAKDS